MARKNNFLLGQGERLTIPVQVPTGGGDKNPPYTLAVAQRRIAERLSVALADFDRVPAEAAPGDQVVGVLTLHPRYSSKSDFPEELLEANGLRVLGSRSVVITPDNWGTQDPPEKEYTEAVFVVSQRSLIRRWQARLLDSDPLQKGSEQLIRVEDFAAFSAQNKVKGIEAGDQRSGVLEVVLHNGGDQRIIEEFTKFVDVSATFALLQT